MKHRDVKVTASSLPVLISDSPDVIEHAMELLLGELKSLEQIAAIKTPDGVTQYEIDAHVLTGEHPPVR